MTMYDRLLIFDTETGGLDANINSILEIGAVVWQRVPGEPGKILGKFRYAVADPTGIVEPEALAVNKIDMETHAGFSPNTCVAMLEDFIKNVYFEDGAYEPADDHGVVLAGHNAATFDVPFLKRLYRLAGDNVIGRNSRYEKMYSHRVMDTCGIVRYLVLAGVLPLTGASSGEAFKYFGIYPEHAHSALADAEATAKLLDKLIELQLPITFVTNEDYIKSDATS